MDRPQDAHDPGGRVRIQLAGDITGTARFSSCGRYRTLLGRDWTAPGADPRSILWIGMNPSTADAEASDPTCNREMIFSRDWGYTRYLKANMLAWRTTNPAQLPRDPQHAQGADNIAHILEAAREAEIIVAAYGRLHARYAGIVAQTLAGIRRTGKPVFCLGRNRDGSAKHPLYLKKTTPLQIF